MGFDEIVEFFPYDTVVKPVWNMQFCDHLRYCPAMLIRLKTRIAPRACCSDNPSINECVVHKVYASLAGKCDGDNINERRFRLRDGMFDIFSRLSVFLGDENNKRVIRERWLESCGEVEVLYREIWGESL